MSNGSTFGLHLEVLKSSANLVIWQWVPDWRSTNNKSFCQQW